MSKKPPKIAVFQNAPLALSSSTCSFTFMVRLTSLDHIIRDPALLASVVGHDRNLHMLQQLLMLLPMPRIQLPKLFLLHNHHLPWMSLYKLMLPPLPQQQMQMYKLKLLRKLYKLPLLPTTHHKLF